MSERSRNSRTRRAGGGRQGRKALRENAVVKVAPFIERKIPYFDYLSEHGLQLIEDNADVLLEEIGIDFLDDPEALEGDSQNQSIRPKERQEVNHQDSGRREGSVCAGTRTGQSELHGPLRPG